MRRTILSSAAVGAALFGVVSAQAAHHKAKNASHHVAETAKVLEVHAVTQTYAQAHHCDWVGPGARAVYRCNLDNGVSPIVVSQNREPQRICDWIGPGARAVYRCRYQ